MRPQLSFGFQQKDRTKSTKNREHRVTLVCLQDALAPTANPYGPMSGQVMVATKEQNLPT